MVNPEMKRFDDTADDEVVRLRRHTRLLRELFETAGELSSATDEDTVIHTLIRRARQLIGTDLAYLMLADPDRGDTYLRASDGAISPGFDTIRLGRGLGLGGQVAESMAPRWTSNYLRDGQYTHVIDPLVIEEGITAILGAPVKKHGQLTGVLFVSDRSEREFSEDEIVLLTLLAEHASTAITAAAERAALEEALASERALLAAETQSAQGLLKTMDLYRRLTAHVREGNDASVLVRHLVSLLGGTAIVYDSRLREVCSAGATSGPLADAVWEMVGDLSALEATVHLGGDKAADQSAQPKVVGTPVMAGAERLGVLGYANWEESEDAGDVLELASALIALILLGQRAWDEADNRLRGELLAEILAPTSNDFEAIKRRAGLLDVDLGGELVAVAVLTADDVVSQVLHAECTTLARQMSGLVTSYGDGVVLVIPGSDARTVAKTAAERLGQYGGTIGTKGPLVGIDAIGDSVHAARSAARFLISLGRIGDGAATDDLGVYGVLFSGVAPDHLASFVDRCLGPLHAYDRDHGTSILQTLRVYFDCEQQAASVADALYIHVNTVYQRLDRVDHILGPDWRLGDRSLEIQLALRLQELAS